MGERSLAIASRRDTGTQSDTFEELVEDDDDGQGDEEGVASNDKRNSND
jgi:hypothetical protein